MLKRSSEFLVRKFPLPPPEERKRHFLMHPWLMGERFDITLDSDYLCFLIRKVLFYLALLATALALVDAYLLDTSFLVDRQALASDKRQILYAYAWITPIPTFLITWLFYLRTRPVFDPVKDPLPSADNLTNESFSGPERGRTGVTIAVLLAGGGMVLGVSWIIAHGLINYFALQENLRLVLLLHLSISPISLALGGGMVITATLASKKAVHMSYQADSDVPEDRTSKNDNNGGR